MVAVRLASVLYYTKTNHLGSVIAVDDAGGGRVDGSYAAYQPFGAFLVPPTETNPSATDRKPAGKHPNL